MTEDRLPKKRQDHEPPPAIAQRGWRYHHMGIPTNRPHHGEQYIEYLKIHVRGFDTSPYGIEWMRFDADCSVSDLIRTVPHIAFEVDDLDEELKGKEVLCPPGSPSNGVRAAMIIHDGAPIELIEFKQNIRKPESF